MWEILADLPLVIYTRAFYSGTCGGLTAIDDCIDMTQGFTNGTNNAPWTYTATPVQLTFSAFQKNKQLL